MHAKSEQAGMREGKNLIETIGKMETSNDIKSSPEMMKHTNSDVEVKNEIKQSTRSTNLRNSPSQTTNFKLKKYQSSRKSEIPIIMVTSPNAEIKRYGDSIADDYQMLGDLGNEFSCCVLC